MGPEGPQDTGTKEQPVTESFWLPTTPEDENVPHLPIPKSHWEKKLTGGRRHNQRQKTS